MNFSSYPARFPDLLVGIFLVWINIATPAKAEEVILYQSPSSSFGELVVLPLFDSVQFSDSIFISSFNLSTLWAQSLNPATGFELELKEDEIAPYQISPRLATDDQVNPFTTDFRLNGQPINHLSQWNVTGGATFGENINTQPEFNSLFKLSGNITESLRADNIFQTVQQGSYLQLRAVDTSRTITTTSQIPQTILGFQLQTSLLGDCALLGKPNGETGFCTLTPGLVVDPEQIDPKTLLPRTVRLTSKVGDSVSQESLAKIQQPGFQRGANGQEFGVDFYLPNTGSISGNTQSNVPQIERVESVAKTVGSSLSWFRQVVKANDTKAVLSRTIRGVPLLPHGDNIWLNTLLSLNNVWLPDWESDLEGSSNPVNRAINRNLFLASNNARLPVASFVIFQTGIGEAVSNTPNITEISQVPSASYNTIWFGLSPDVSISLENQSYYQFLGAQQVIGRAGSEGGFIPGRTNLVVDNQPVALAELSNFYTQSYVSFFKQEVNLIDVLTVTEDYQHYPHLSFSGNITSALDVWRYYFGNVFSRQSRLYGGTDYTYNSLDNLSFSLGAIGYVNPNREYYSRVWGNLAKSFSLPSDQSISLGSRFNYAIDRPIPISNFGEAVLPSLASYFIVEGQYRWRWLSLKLTNNFGNILPKSIGNQLLISTSWQLSPTFLFNAYWAPLDENSASFNLGASFDWQLSNKKDGPSLSVSWNQIEYDFGNTSQGETLQQQDQVFKILFRLGNNTPVKVR